MSEEQLKELQEYNLEYLEAQASEEMFGGDFTSAVELKQANKEIERLNNIIKEAREYLTDEGVCILNKGKKENERLVWTWENYYDLLEILKGSEKE